MSAVSKVQPTAATYVDVVEQQSFSSNTHTASVGVSKVLPTPSVYGIESVVTTNIRLLTSTTLFDDVVT